MAELRLDPATRRWIVTGKRTVTSDVSDCIGVCPFCPGNEHLTPKPILESRDSGGAWMVRVFHDRAPVFRIEGGLDPRGEGMFDRMNTLGAHEIVVETAQHGATLAQLSVEQIARVVQVWRDRILDLKRDRRFRYVSLFKEQNVPMAAVQGHSFSQVLAIPVLPEQPEGEYRWSQYHFRKKERCLYCDIIQQDTRQEKRVVDQNANFISLCPFASRWPYEVWLLPLRHSSSFEKDLLDPTRLSSLASFLKSSLQRVETISQKLYLVVHTEPNLEGHKLLQDDWTTLTEDFHWHIEINPEIDGQHRYLGCEGLHFNPIPAEEAALVLRALEPEAEPVPAPSSSG